MANNAFIVTACKKYIPELNALLNSLDFVGSKADVHLWHYDFPPEYLESIIEADWCYALMAHTITYDMARKYGGESEELCRKRYWYAGEIGKHYKAVCVLDADMVFVRDPWQFFEIAHQTGFIIGTHKEQNKKYNDDHHRVKGEFIYDPNFVNDKDLCNAPLFIDANLYEKPLKRCWDIFADGFPETNFKAPDMDAMNLAFLEYGVHDMIIKLPNVQWLGTNEQGLKPYTRIGMHEDDGLLWAENGIEIFSFHGQYYKKKWRECQLDNRHRCADGYLGCSEKSDSMARGAMNTMYRWFCKMCFDHKVTVEKKDYVHPELPYEE